MSDTRVTHSNGRHGLGGSRDADLEDIDPDQYDVFTTDKNLAEARAAYPDYDWFACFSVKDKKGNYANIAYTLKFDKPASGALYYYLNGAVHPLQYADTDKKGRKNRVKATLNVGDPPVGMR
jgi:hypothetical protein